MVIHPDIILIGASVRSLAVSAIKDGWTPLCLDMFADADLATMLEDPQRQLCRLNRFEDAPKTLEGLNPEIPLVWSGGLENHPELIDQLSKKHNVVGSDTQAINTVRDSQALFRVFDGSECLVPDWCESPSTGLNGDSRNMRWLLKSRRSAGGTHVRPVSAELSVMPCGNDEYYQEFINGTPFSATFVTTGAHKERQTYLLGSALQLSGYGELHAPAFHHCGNIGPIQLPVALREHVMKTGFAVADEFHLCGVFGVDFILNEKGLWGLEVNPRVTASHELHEWAYPERPSHVTLQERATGRGDHRTFSMVLRAEDRSLKTLWARLVLYTERDIRITSEECSRLLNLTRSVGVSESMCPTVFSADIPPHDSCLPHGVPLCSVYVNMKGDWERPLAELQKELNFAGRYCVEEMVRRSEGECRAISGDSEIDQLTCL